MADAPQDARLAAIGSRGRRLGLVDGSIKITTQRFTVVLEDDAVVQLDDLLTVSRSLPDGTIVTHFGIVVELTGEIEGAGFPSDTRRIAADHTMPGQTSRRAEVQILRTDPEKWVPPDPGCPCVRAVGASRETALFHDQMTQPLPVGLDQAGDPVWIDYAFLSGEKGAHASISGISGVATKTSYATFLLYMLLETEQGRRMLREYAPQTKALIFNVKSEDLLHLDRPNRRFGERERARAEWAAMGVPNPGAFTSVRVYAPRSAGRPGANATDVSSRAQGDVTPYGWTPHEFIRRGLLEFCFSDREDRRGQNQVSFVEQRIRAKLLKHAFPHPTERGGVVLVDTIPQGTPPNFEERRPVAVGEGSPFLEFADLVRFLEDKLDNNDPTWTAGTVPGTQQAFLRRLYAQAQQFGHLITVGVDVIRYDEALTVVDIHSLQEPAQRFVVGALLHEIFQGKQGRGREPLHFVVLDELNKYAPRDGSSPIKDILVDISARGRSLGVILVGAQQSAGDVDGNVIRNASIKVVGRLDAGDVGDYGFLSPELRQRAARFLPGTMVLDQPLVPAPIPIRFPFPAYATCQDEAMPPDTPQTRARLTSLLSER
jgi:hypothetical protein